MTEYTVKPLSNENTEEFLNYMDSQFLNNSCLRPDWFDRDLPWALQHRYKNYLHWSIVYSKNKIVAFAALQHYKYRCNTVRVCSRLYFDPSERYTYSKDNYKSVITPFTPIIIDQFNILKDKNYTYAIATIESSRSITILKKIAEGINSKTNGLTNFVVKNDRIQTYNGQPSTEFQYYMEHKFSR